MGGWPEMFAPPSSSSSEALRKEKDDLLLSNVGDEILPFREHYPELMKFENRVLNAATGLKQPADFLHGGGDE